MARDPSHSSRFLPVGLDVHGKLCVVVGGGRVGTRKVRTLVRAGSVVKVVAPTVTDELSELIRAGNVEWVADEFHDRHIQGAYLVIAATDDKRLNATVVQRAAQNHALYCDASSAERSQIIFGALLQEKESTVAVFTDGRDPARARRTRDRIAELLDSDRGSEGE